MGTLLELDELKFLEETNELLSDYMDNEVIFDTIMICTKRQLRQSDYLKKFNDFFECIRRKMWQLSRTSERSMRNELIPQPQSSMTVPGVIDARVIMRAFLRGYKHLKSRLEKIAENNSIELEELENKKELGFTLVLTILARSNLDNRFAK